MPQPDPYAHLLATPPVETARLAPYWLTRDQQWAREQVEESHLEALYALGEYSMFVLLWHSMDFEAGLVDRCARCYLAAGRIAEAFGQGTDARCPDCFGTTFEGGYRARIIRPGIWTDASTNTSRTPRGEVVSDTMTVETTSDFVLRHGDFIFRAGGLRYQSSETDGAWVRSGFDVPDDIKAVASVMHEVKLEDDRASVAFDIPPTDDDLSVILRAPLTRHLVPDMSAYEDIRGPLVV